MNLHCFGLFEFLKLHNNTFKAQDDIVISAIDGREIKVGRVLNQQTRLDNEIFRLYKAEDFTRLAEDTSQLARYDLFALLHGEMPVYISIPELEMELTFRTVDDDTFIYSLADHFYDEVTALENLDDYKDYMKKRSGLLYAVYECRNKYCNAVQSK